MTIDSFLCETAKRWVERLIANAAAFTIPYFLDRAWTTSTVRELQFPRKSDSTCSFLSAERLKINNVTAGEKYERAKTRKSFSNAS